MIDVGRGTAQSIAAAARDRGVVLAANPTLNKTRIRLVTHLDVSRELCLHAAKVIAEIAAA